MQPRPHRRTNGSGASNHGETVDVAGKQVEVSVWMGDPARQEECPCPICESRSEAGPWSDVLAREGIALGEPDRLPRSELRRTIRRVLRRLADGGCFLVPPTDHLDDRAFADRLWRHLERIPAAESDSDHGISLILIADPADDPRRRSGRDRRLPKPPSPYR